MSEWRKDCSCEATPIARTDGTRMKQVAKPDGTLICFTYIPGPSCEKCGKPWVEVDKPS